MTLNHYVVSKDGRVLKFLKNCKSGNPYRDALSKFSSRDNPSREEIEKAMKMYFIDQFTNKVMTKEEFDERLAQMFLDIKEVEE